MNKTNPEHVVDHVKLVCSKQLELRLGALICFWKEPLVVELLKELCQANWERGITTEYLAKYDITETPEPTNLVNKMIIILLAKEALADG